MKALTANHVANICGVDRTTVGYWVRTGKLQAQREGRKYMIHECDLRLFLESTGQAIPEEISANCQLRLDFPTIQPCWEFFKTDNAERRCETCCAFKNAAEPCFTYRELGSVCCTVRCMDCEYYRKNYAPRINFIHQINMPAAIYRGSHIWGANHPFETLHGFEPGGSIGTGIERVVHPDSMEMVIAYARRRTLGACDIPNNYDVHIKARDNGKIPARTLVSPLIEPKGTFLVILNLLKGRP